MSEAQNIVKQNASALAWSGISLGLPKISQIGPPGLGKVQY